MRYTEKSQHVAIFHILHYLILYRFDRSYNDVLATFPDMMYVAVKLARFP